MSSKLGPLPRFAEAHVRMALEVIAKHGQIGRQRLAKELGVGEGSVRTILNQLKRRRLIISSRRGHALTGRGLRFLEKPFELVQIGAGDLTVGEFDVATIVRSAAGKVRCGVEQRDEAIKAGASGATVLIYRGGKFQFPNGSLKIGKGLSGTLTKTFKPREGDVIVIGSARDTMKAEAGAKAAARTLLGDIKGRNLDARD